MTEINKIAAAYLLIAIAAMALLAFAMYRLRGSRDPEVIDLRRRTELERGNFGLSELGYVVFAGLLWPALLYALGQRLRK